MGRTDNQAMEWLMLFPLLFFVPLVWARWQRRAIAEGVDLEVTFDMALPSKWAAELTQRALTGEGVQSRIFREEHTWLCSVVRSMKYQREAIEKASKRLDQVAGARGGGCVRYKLTLGERQETHRIEASDTCV